jgi:hypothetical protein
MNTCPHCGSPDCLPLWRKFTLGPAASAQCRNCSFKVGVDVAKASAAMAPTGLLIVVAAFGILRDPVTLIVLLILCLGATFFLYGAWVPLRPDELSNARMVKARIESKEAMKRSLEDR